LVIHALTIDVEDWFHPELVRERVSQSIPEGRAPEDLLPILNVLNRHKVRATFFILGDVARRFPNLVRRIYHEGHELGSHGMSHHTSLGMRCEHNESFSSHCFEMDYILRDP
jgi:hypothetical protein